MENKSVMVSAFFLALAAVLLAMAFHYWREADDLRDILRPEMVHVMTAARDLPAGAVLDEDCVEVRDLPRRFVESGAYELHSSADIRLISKLVAIVRIPKGNQLIRSSLLVRAAKPDPAIKPKTESENAEAQMHYIKGLKYFQNDDYTKAREEWNKVLKLEPKNIDAAAGLHRIDQILNPGN